MKELARDGKYVYLKIEEASEIEKFIIPKSDSYGGEGESFIFFRGMGISDYEKTFKSWLRRFPRPVFIVAVDNKMIVSWIYIEEWTSLAMDGEPIYILRAIETLPRLRRKKVGFRILMLGLKQTIGYMITKPVTTDSERFFRGFGFMGKAEFRRCPIDLSRLYGYLILPPFRKKKALEDASKYFNVIH